MSIGLKYRVLGVLLFLSIAAYSQYSKIHYLPPTYNQKSNIEFSTITVTTLEDIAFDVFLTNASGSFTENLNGLSKDNPITITLPIGDNDGIFKGNESKINQVLDSEGFILTADKYFFTSQIHAVKNQAAVIAPKGYAGLGTEFYSGHIYSATGTNDSRAHFLSIIASEDNTIVTFDNPKIKWEGQINNKFSITLNKGESYVLAAPFNYISDLIGDDPFNDYNGTHVTSDKPIVMNSGSFLASSASKGQDAGVDQLVPVSQLNSEFILAQGQSTIKNLETAMVIASEDNTEVYINGSETSSYTLNKGENAIINGDNYINKTMHIKTSRPAMVFQNLASTNSSANVGMVFVPGLMEDASRAVLVSGANSIGSVSLYIIAKKREELKINGIEIKSSPIENAGNANWVTYRISPDEINANYCTSGSNCSKKGEIANFLIESTGPINAAISMVDGVVGAAGYFSGFAAVNTDVGVSDFGTLEYTLPCIQDTVSLFAKGANSYSWDSPSGNMDLVTELNDSTIFFDYDQSGNEGPFTYRIIMESTSILGYTQHDTVLLNVNVKYTDECKTDFINEDTLFICLGDSIQINANNVNETQWYGEEPFRLLNDSTIIAKPSKTTTYYFSNLIKKQNALINGDFEEPDLGVFNYQFVNSSLVPGWNTTASDNQIEVWYDGFLGAPAYKGKQFIELNANMSSALYQDMPTTPNTKLMWGFAHRGRAGVDYMEFEVGPPEGPYEKIGTFSDGQDWKFYSGIYEVPTGQNNTRFYYTSTQGGSLGNLLDAIEFFTLEENIDSIVVVVNDLPNIYLGKDTTICIGEEITFEFKGAKDYEWNNGISTSEITVSEQAEYSLTITDENSCKNSDTVNLTTQNLPFVNLGGDTTICKGDTIYLDAQNTGLNFHWNTNNYDQTIPISESGVYNVKVTDDLGCFGSDSIEVIIKEKPIVELGPNQKICEGRNIQLDAQNEGLLYNWNNGKSTQKITLTQSGIYRVDITDEIGCVGTDEMELIVNSNPTVDLGNDTSFCMGESFTLNAMNNGLNFEWSSGETTQEINVNFPGEYQVVVTDEIGCIDSSVIKLTVNELPIVNLGNDQEICEGDSISLNAQNDGLNYKWNTGENTQKIHAKSTGDYQVVVYDNLGCADSSKMKLTVNPLPNVNLGNNQTICKGESLTLNAQNNGYNYEWNTGESTQKIEVSSNGNYQVIVFDDIGCADTSIIILTVNELPVVNLGNDKVVCEDESVRLNAQNDGYYYKWNTGEETQEININNTGDYQVIVFDDVGCADTSLIKLTVNKLPVVDLGEDKIICRGESIVLNAQNDGYIYKWNTGDNSKEIEVNSSGNYQIIVFDDIGCADTSSMNLTIHELPIVNLGNDQEICEGESIRLNAQNDGFNYKWNTGSNSKEIDVHYSGDYQVVVFDEVGCADTSKMKLTVHPLPLVNLGKDQTICQGESVILDANNIGFNYKWSTGAISEKIIVHTPGRYEVFVFDELGCADTSALNINVNELPKVNIGNETVLCESQTFILDAGNQGANFIWNNGSKNQTIEISEEGLYSVEVRDEIGCLGTDEVLITQEIIEDPYLEKEKNICEGTSIVLEPDFYEDYNIYWELNVFNSTMEVSESGSYASIVESEHCIDTFFINVTKIDTPKAVIQDLNGQDYYCFNRETTSLAVLSEEPFISYVWDEFGRNEEVEIEKEGTYAVTVYNEYCSSRLEKTIKNHCKGIFYIPKAFTPGNNDGLNDIFMPVANEHVEEFDFKIFNRWGTLIFSTKIQGEGWDGRINGSPAQIDIYSYRLSYSYPSEYEGLKHDKRVGNFTLLR